MADAPLTPEQIQKKLIALGVESPWMAPLYLPKRFVDYTNPVTNFKNLIAGETQTVYISRGDNVKRGRGKMSARAFDDSGATLFINAFGDTAALESRLSLGRPVCVRAKVGEFNGALQLQNPELVADSDINKVTAVYAGKAGAVATSAVAGMLQPLLTEENYATAAMFITKRLGLPDIRTPDIQALIKAAHQPESVEIGDDAIRKLDVLAAKDIILTMERQGRNLDAFGAHIPATKELVEQAIEEMPLPLTEEQQNAVRSIVDDLRSPFPAKHLLSGDVGTGKTATYGTVVAAARKAGAPVAIMAPNSPLASQIVKELNSWWPELDAKLVTGDPEKKPDMVAAEIEDSVIETAQRENKPLLVVVPNKQLAEDTMAKIIADKPSLEGSVSLSEGMTKKEGLIDGHIYVGTPTVLKLMDTPESATIAFDPTHRFKKNQKESLEAFVGPMTDLDALDPSKHVYVGTTALLNRLEGGMKDGLFIVDEQQKFSTDQRERILGAGANLLEATGTCIPRTMALVMFSGSNVSRLEKCHVEKKIITKVLPTDQRFDALNQINEIVGRGGKALVVYPLAEHGNDADKIASSAEGAYHNLWSKRYPGKVRYVHGKMNDEEKSAAIQALKDGDAQILISTTVVEVGIDVPGLEVVAVVDAERHGLQGLHQIRGRVARKGGTGYCFLLPSSEAKEESVDRLKLMEKCSSGFELAFEDMKNRGLGDISINGATQSGKTPSILIGRDIAMMDIHDWVENPEKPMDFQRLPADKVLSFTAPKPQTKPLPAANQANQQKPANQNTGRPVVRPTPQRKFATRF